MEDEGEQSNAVASPFPRPPPFFEHFTAENIARLQEIRPEESKSSTAAPAPLKESDVTGLDGFPTELRFLVPPDPPTSGTYRSFGEKRDINETLPALPEGIEQLYPHTLKQPDRAQELLKISKSLLLNFLDLVGTLAANPELARPKIDDLRTLFFNAHQLVNEYRPHQARETLITMIEQRLEQRRSEVEYVKAMREKVGKLLADLGEPKADQGTEQSAETKKSRDTQLEKQNDEQRRLEPVVISKKNGYLRTTDQCTGNSYSGRLKYLQNCHSLIFAHDMQWIQPFEYLMVSDGPRQNYVSVQRDFSDLKEKVLYYLEHKDEAKRIATNSVETFRDRYLTPAAEACYWRKLINAWSEVSSSPDLFEQASDGRRVLRGIPFEDYALMQGADFLRSG